MSDSYHSATDLEDAHKLLGWKHDDPGWGTYLKCSFTLGRGRSQHSFEDGAKMLRPETPDAPSDFTFGNVLLEHMLRNENYTKEADLTRYLDAMGVAMMTRHREAVYKLWDFVCAHDFLACKQEREFWRGLIAPGVWPPVTAGLIQFLALEVQRPYLLLAVVQSCTDNKHILSTEGFRTEVMEPLVWRAELPESEKQVDFSEKASRKPLLTTIAAILSAHYYVDHDPLKSFEQHVSEHERKWEGLAETSKHELREYDDRDPLTKMSEPWDRVLDLLFGLLQHHKEDPLYDGTIYIATVDNGCYTWRPMNLIVLTMLCSELTEQPLNSALRWCEWSRTHIATAIRWALKPGTLRGDTMLSVLNNLYSRFLKMNPRKELPHAWLDERRGDHAQTALWVELVKNASGYRKHTLIGLPDVVRVQRYDGQPQDPEVFVKILSQWTWLHLRWDFRGRERADLRACLCKALTRCFEVLSEPGERVHAHLLYQVCETLHKDEHFRPCLLSSKDGDELPLVRVLKNHVDMLPDLIQLLFFKDGVCQVEVLDVHYDDVFTAFVEAIHNHKRESVRQLLDLLEHNAERLAQMLNEKPRSPILADFVMRLCDSEKIIVNCSSPEYTMAQLPNSVRATMHEVIHDDLVRILKAGRYESKEHEEPRKSALRQASRMRSAIAAQVLVSPPYNTPMPENDEFVRRILDAVLAPEAPIAQEVCESLKKRARVEEGEQ